MNTIGREDSNRITNDVKANGSARRGCNEKANVHTITPNAANAICDNTVEATSHSADFHPPEAIAITNAANVATADVANAIDPVEAAAIPLADVTNDVCGSNINIINTNNSNNNDNRTGGAT